MSDLYVCVSKICPTHHEAAPLLGVANAEHDDDEKDGAHGDPRHQGPGEDGLLHVGLPSGAVEGGAVDGRHGVATNVARPLTGCICVCAIKQCSRISPHPASTSQTWPAEVVESQECVVCVRPCPLKTRHWRPGGRQSKLSCSSHAVMRSEVWAV